MNEGMTAGPVPAWLRIAVDGDDERLAPRAPRVKTDVELDDLGTLHYEAHQKLGNHDVVRRRE